MRTSSVSSLFLLRVPSVPHFLRLLFASLLLSFSAGPVFAQGMYVEFSDRLPDGPVEKTIAIDRVVGDGQETVRGQFVVLEYEGWVYDLSAPERKGRKFDSTKDRGQSLSVLAGVNRMITGFDRGIMGMRVGGKRTLVVPPKLGYGTRIAFGEVPPNSTLIFDVELLDVVPASNVP